VWSWRFKPAYLVDHPLIAIPCHIHQFILMIAIKQVKAVPVRTANKLVDLIHAYNAVVIS
jgi:hypothetical protein